MRRAPLEPSSSAGEGRPERTALVFLRPSELDIMFIIGVVRGTKSRAARAIVGTVERQPMAQTFEEIVADLSEQNARLLRGGWKRACIGALAVIAVIGATCELVGLLLGLG